MSKDWKFEDNSAKVKRQMRDVSEVAMEAALLVVEASMKSKARVDSGELRDKLGHKIMNRGSEVIGQAGSPSKHSIWNEFGTGEYAENGAGRKGGWVYKAPNGKWYYTKGMRPSPFVRPAFRENKKNIQDIIGKEFGVKFKGE